MKMPGLLDPRELTRSMAGRIFLFLTVGMIAAAIVSLVLAESKRNSELERLQLERVVQSVAEIRYQLTAEPVETQALLDRNRIIGVRRAPGELAIAHTDEVLVGMLREALGPDAAPDAGEVSNSLCFPPSFEGMSDSAKILRRSRDSGSLSDCWIVRFSIPGTMRYSLAIALPPITLPKSSALDPLYLLVLVLASGMLSVVVARIAASPLERLTKAANAFSLSLDAETIDERGPREVRSALATFNLMQKRVRDGLANRTQLLAAISHDLQTPLTRLRLRAEEIDDQQIKGKFVADLAAMQTLVREGLDLARSSESSEDWSRVDIDSLVASLVEDAAELGAAVRFLGGCGLSLRVKPNALSRALNNLIENAISYGGGAEVSCILSQKRLVISVRDHGPGIAPEAIDRMFEPFVRGENPMAGARRSIGIGLTIARAQARASGADVFLRNHPEGGLVAEIELSLPP